MESAFARAAMMYGIMILISFSVAALISFMTRLLGVMKRSNDAEGVSHQNADGTTS